MYTHHNFSISISNSNPPFKLRTKTCGSRNHYDVDSSRYGDEYGVGKIGGVTQTPGVVTNVDIAGQK